MQKLPAMRRLQFEFLEPRQLFATAVTVDSTFTYLPNAAPALVAPQARLSAPDVANFSGSTIDITLGAQAVPSDFIAIRSQGTNPGQIELHWPAISYDQRMIGTIYYGPAPIGT